MKKYKTGLVIGRFQPFHLGHKFLMEEALKVCEMITIEIGSSNIIDNHNPYSCEKREKFIEAFINDSGIEDRVVGIIPIEDDPDDDVWLSKLIESTGKFDVSIGDNQWVNGIFEKAKIPVVGIGFYRREILEGTTIRKLMKERKKWEDRVPSCLVSTLSE